MINKMITRTGIATILALGMNNVGAMDTSAEPGHGYFGFGLGMVNLHGQAQTITISPGVTETVTPNSSSRPAARLYAGYNYNPYLAVESGFTYYYYMTYNTPNSVSNSMKTQLLTLDFYGKGIFPVWQSGFSAYAKLGGAFVYIKTNGKVGGVSPPVTTATGFRPAAGLGVSYDMTPNWVLDLSYSQIFYKSSVLKNPDTILLAIAYHLFDPKCGQFLC